MKDNLRKVNNNEVIAQVKANVTITEEEQYKNMTISHDYMFFSVMQNEELCKEMLETILDVEIEKIEYFEQEKQIKEVYNGKGIRLDVYVRDDKRTIYNLEMQVSNRDNIPKRTRYYQSMIDKNLLSAGVDYDDINDSIIIFICRFDLFGYGKAKYTFKNMCKEVEGLEMGDNSSKIFVNTKALIDEEKAKEMGISEKLLKLLYLQRSLKNYLPFLILLLLYTCS